jgi:hypothetical protein
LFHTADTHRGTFDALAPDAVLTHVVRPDWLARAQDGMTPDLEAEIVDAIRAAEGPTLCTCSTIGPAAEKAGALRIDWPMMQVAARLGGPVLMTYALASTRAPSQALLERAFAEAGKSCDVTLLDLTDLWPLCIGGKPADFADAIAARLAVALTERDYASAVLAQASMAAAAGRTQTRVPVLTSPELALRALLA